MNHNTKQTKKCPKCGKDMEFIEQPNEDVSCAAPMFDMYWCDNCLYSTPADTEE